MFSSIKWRLTLVYLILILLSLTIMGAFLLEAMNRSFVEETEENLTAHARVFSHYAELTFLGNDLAKKFGTDVDARVQILDDRGVVVGDSLWPDVPIGEPLAIPEVEAALAGEVLSHLETLPDGERIMHVAAPLRTGGSSDIIGVVYLSSSLERADQTLELVRNLLIFGIILALFFSLLVGFYLAGTVTGPIREVTKAANQVAKGDFEWKLHPHGKDELAQLAATFNYLTGRLKATIAEISDERKKLAAVMASMGDGLVAIDQEGKGLLINPAAEVIFGIKQPEVIGQPLRDKLNHQLLWSLFQEVLAQGETLVAELQTARQREAIFRAQVSPILAAEGNVTGAVAVLRDITDLRRLEQMRLQFLSNVSHELRTPLTSIKGFAVTLADELSPSTPAQRYVTIIEQETDRLTRLVNDLLDLSKIDTLQLTMEMVSLQPRELLEGCVQQMVPRAQRAGIALQAEIPANLPRFLGDADRLKQILINLLDNALKFTPAGGQVVVSAWADAQQFNISVRDTGCGIPAADIPHIFERFYRVDKARSRALGGTGLGLSIVKVLVEQHGGSITVNSEVDIGTEFIIHLPRN
ncbi:MAG: two-component system histidine kinase PnpS [bacterium]|jgi:PAS domain S-box-containing protein